MLDLDWQAAVFRASRALLGRAFPARRSQRAEGSDRKDAPSGPDDGRVARLSVHAASLTAFARVVSGRPVRVVAEGTTAPSELDLVLPAVMAAAPEAERNRAIYLVRTALGAATLRIDSSAPADGDETTPTERARAWIALELPGFERLVESLRHDVPDDILFGSRPAIRAPAPALAPTRDGAAPATREADQPINEAEAPRIGSIERVELEKDDRGDVVLNPFERVETLDEWRGGARNLDGADDLDAHLEALSEVDLGKLTRGGGPARSLLRADVRLDCEVPDVERDAALGRGLPYDEWDARAGRYRPGWCTVHPRPCLEADPGWAAEARRRQRRRIDALAHRLERLRTGLVAENRQLDGDDLDLDELVAERAAWRAGQGGDGRVYVRSAKRRRDFATTVLVDVSLSTDAWVRGHRVLDVAREAVFVLGEVADRLGDRLRILAFASETRHRCQVWDLLGWHEPWARGAARLGALRPRGYTRIGAAIRHAVSDQSGVSAERKLLLLVSDAKPTDYDRYEGRHGIADVRQAVREAERSGIRAHALAIDSEARDWLPALFGPGAWHALPRPERTVDVLAEVYGRLTALPR